VVVLARLDLEQPWDVSRREGSVPRNPS
jgi:hypothetical protein